MSEFCSDDAAVAVWSGDFAPDHSDFAALSFCCGTVDVGDALAEVESRSKKCQSQDDKKKQWGLCESKLLNESGVAPTQQRSSGVDEK